MEDLTRAELIKLASEQGIEVSNTDKKADLIAKLNAVELPVAQEEKVSTTKTYATQVLENEIKKRKAREASEAILNQ